MALVRAHGVVRHDAGRDDKFKARPAPHCRRCPAWRSAATICCPGRGSFETQADVIFLTEVPLKEEDTVGQTFQGRGGALFDLFRSEYLHGVSWYGTTAVRCHLGFKANGEPVRPWAGSEKNPGPMRACRHFLEQDIQLLRPKVIVAMGNYALAQALGVPVGSIKLGKLLCIPTQGPDGVPVFAIHHPSWVLRAGIDATGDGPGIPIWESQWEQLSRYLKGQSIDLPGEYEWQPAPDCDLEFPPGGTVVIDFETTGLNPRKDSFRMAGFCAKPYEAVVVGDVEGQGRGTMEKFLDRDGPWACHEFGMELYWFFTRFGRMPRGTLYDTKVLHYILDENTSQKLEDLVDTDAPEFSGFKRATEAIGVAEAPDNLLAQRCAYDCMATRQLANTYWSRLSEKQQETYREVIEPALRAIVECKARGWRFDRAKLDDLIARAEQRCGELYRMALEIREVKLFEESLQAGRKGKQKLLPINFNSRKEVPDLLATLGVKPDPSKPKHLQPNDRDRMRTAADVLQHYADKHPFIPLLLEYKKVHHALTHFLRVIRDSLDERDMVYPAFNLGGAALGDQSATGTVTWRLSCGKPNMMNLPRPGKEEEDPYLGSIRSCVIPHEEGGLILSADYSQVELRIMAALSGEEALIEVFRAGGDPHQMTADRMGRDRHTGKTLNFAAPYGATAHRIMETANCSLKEAEDLLADLWAAYPDLELYFQRVRREAAVHGYVEGPFGFRVHCPDIHSPDPKVAAHAARRVGNWPIQHTGAILTLQAMGAVRKALEGSNSFLFGQLHDALYVHVAPDEEPESVAEVVRWAMLEYSRSLPWLTVPLEVDVKWGTSMAG